MALGDGNANGMIMPVAPTGGLGVNGMGGDWAWIVLLLLLGWGNQGFGANGGNGFQTAQLANQLSAIQSGVTGLGTQMCNSFAGAEAANNSRQIANMQQMFDLSTQFGNCCCENRLATANLNTAIANAANQIVQNQNVGFQSIKDQLCQDKIEEKNDLIAQLRSELMYARGQASQDVQTAAIQAGQRALANEVEQYVLPTPRPAYIVQNPNCCQQFGACTCGA